MELLKKGRLSVLEGGREETGNCMTSILVTLEKKIRVASH